MKNYKPEEIKSLISLFKVAPYTDIYSVGTTDFVDCVKNGFVFIDKNGSIKSQVPIVYSSFAYALYGSESFKCNQTFYKSFATVRDISPEQHLADQLMHYFSTYGLESLGLSAQPYLPVQELQIDGWDVKADKLVVIRLVDDDKITELIDKFAINTVSPSQRIIDDFNPLMKYITVPTDDIKSFELQIIKHDMDGTVPQNPVSFLRYLVYKTTGQTLLIKNRKLCGMIKCNATNPMTAPMVERIFAKGNEVQLASIFLRYKPIFLAYKAYPGCRSKINRLRRLADKYHKPLSDVSVQNVTNLIREGRFDDLQSVVSKASNRELVKLINAIDMAFMAQNDTPGVYSIRNGKTFVKDNAYKLTDVRNGACGILIVKEELRRRLTPVLSGKKFYLPIYINYATPVTEKQFTGNIPWGTLITDTPDSNFTAGVCWMNQKGQRVDIDLHLNSAARHFGWNGGWRDGSDILYTGDQTSAPEPNGAAEAFWFNPNTDDYIMDVSLFFGPKDTEYKMFMTSVKPDVIGKKYTYNSADALFPPIPMNFYDERQQTLGIFVKDYGFYFYGGAMSSGIVPTANYEQFIKGLKYKLTHTYMMSDLLRDCGAIEVASVDKDTIDLSPESLNATTLLDIVDGNL